MKQFTNRKMILSLFGFVILLSVILNYWWHHSSASFKREKVRYRHEHEHFHLFRQTKANFPIGYSLEMLKAYRDLPTIYVITPTNSRRFEQRADLTKMLNTLLLVPKIFWILVEDSPKKTKKITKFLENITIPHVHLNVQTPPDHIKGSDYDGPKGAVQRNAGIKWLEKHQHELDQQGVVYFADDDNTYDIRLFEEMRFTKNVSVFPVAFVGGILYERPVCENGVFIEWYTAWKPERPFALDMAGFAVSLKRLLSHPEAKFSLNIEFGMEEPTFLSKLVRPDELECKAEDGTKIYVWHTETMNAMLQSEKDMSRYSLKYEQKILDQI